MSSSPELKKKNLKIKKNPNANAHTNSFLDEELVQETVMDGTPSNILLRSPLRVNQRGMVQRDEKKKKKTPSKLPALAHSLGYFREFKLGRTIFQTVPLEIRRQLNNFLDSI